MQVLRKRFVGNLAVYFYRNSRFGDTVNVSFGGFASLSGSYVNVSLEGFSAKNISVLNRGSLIEMYKFDIGQKNLIRMNIWDFVLEDIVEIGDPLELHEVENDIITDITEENGLIFHLSGLIELSVRNLTGRNLKFESIQRGI